MLFTNQDVLLKVEFLFVKDAIVRIKKNYLKKKKGKEKIIIIRSNRPCNKPEMILIPLSFSPESSLQTRHHDLQTKSRLTETTTFSA